MRWYVSRLPTPLEDRLLNLKASGSGELVQFTLQTPTLQFFPRTALCKGGGRRVAKSPVSQAHVWGEVSFG